MSDLAAVGVGAGIGALMMTAVVVALWDQIVAGWRVKFGQPDTDQPARAPQSIDSGQRSRMRVALGFYAITTTLTLAVGLALDQTIVAICGALGVVLLGVFVLLEHRP